MTKVRQHRNNISDFNGSTSPYGIVHRKSSFVGTIHEQDEVFYIEYQNGQREEIGVGFEEARVWIAMNGMVFSRG